MPWLDVQNAMENALGAMPRAPLKQLGNLDVTVEILKLSFPGLISTCHNSSLERELNRGKPIVSPLRHRQANGDDDATCATRHLVCLYYQLRLQ